MRESESSFQQDSSGGGAIERKFRRVRGNFSDQQEEVKGWKAQVEIYSWGLWDNKWLIIIHTFSLSIYKSFSSSPSIYSSDRASDRIINSLITFYVGFNIPVIWDFSAIDRFWLFIIWAFTLWSSLETILAFSWIAPRSRLQRSNSSSALALLSMTSLRTPYTSSNSFRLAMILDISSTV